MAEAKPMTRAEKIAFLKEADFETLSQSDQLLLLNEMQRERQNGVVSETKPPQNAEVVPHKVNPSGPVAAAKPRRVQKNIR